ncbi:MAG: phytanoyl-CoA dioxygenase family protein, partial [Caldilineaceae bacterium]|nr:phytanoyl-CoA dioxygenase family protein [Caldilineaceae bacterium]
MTVAAPERQFDDGLSGDFPQGLYDPTGVVTGVDGFDAVTDAHVAQFHEQGYLIVENAFTAQEVQIALDGLFHLLSDAVEEFNGVQYERASAGVAIEDMSVEEKQDYVRKFMSFVDYDERLNELAHHPLLLALVERLIGEAPVLFQSMALLKPPRLGRDKPWHQDAAYFQIELDAKVVGCWMALDEATIEN